MRALAILSLIAALGAAEPENLLPRSGSGWAGFKPGSFVRLKLIQIYKGQDARVTIWKTTLKKVGANTLTLETVAGNALGIEQKTPATVPAKGEAGPGETATTEDLGAEVILVGRKRLACRRIRTKIRSKAGRRVITDWVAKDPKVRAKRMVTAYDAAGNQVSSVTMVVNSLNETRTIGAKRVRCLRYRFLSRWDDSEESGIAYTSRDMPGNDVYMDTKVKRAGVVILEKRLRTLEFDAK